MFQDSDEAGRIKEVLFLQGYNIWIGERLLYLYLQYDNQ
jgi:hypothetical protein